jgi:hypothetical protein
MAQIYTGPFWNGKPEHDQNIYDMIVSKAKRMRGSRPEFKAGISEDDFVGEAFLLFQSRKVHKNYEATKGDFWRFFAVSLRNMAIDKLGSTYSHVKSGRARGTDDDSAKNDKLSGSEMAIQRLDDENLHERVTVSSDSPEAIIGLEEYEAQILELAPTLAGVWLGSINHPHEMVHPVKGHPLTSRKERISIVAREADRMLDQLGDYLFGFELSVEQHEEYVETIVDQFSRWRGERGSYKKKPHLKTFPIILMP